MKVTEKQLSMLINLLNSSLNMDVQGYLCYDFETRKELLQVITNQQSDNIVEVKPEVAENDDVLSLIMLYRKVNKIYTSDSDWDVKYDQIFSNEISLKIDRLIKLDYCDPDAGYEDDVKAYVFALRNYMIDNDII